MVLVWVEFLVPWEVGYTMFHLGLATIRLMQFIVGSCMAAMSYLLGSRLLRKCCWVVFDLLRFCCHMHIKLHSVGGLLGCAFIGSSVVTPG